jgi:hypothetical protein
MRAIVTFVCDPDQDAEEKMFGPTPELDRLFRAYLRARLELPPESPRTPPCKE